MAATGGSFFSGAVEKRNRNHESRDTSCLVILDGVGKEGIKEIDPRVRLRETWCRTGPKCQLNQSAG